MYYHGLKCRVQHNFKKLENKYDNQILKQPQQKHMNLWYFYNIHDLAESVFNISCHSIVQHNFKVMVTA